MNRKTIARDKERQQQVAILNQVAEEMHKKGATQLIQLIQLIELRQPIHLTAGPHPQMT